MVKNPNYQYGSKDVLIPVGINFGEFVLDRIVKSNDKIALLNGENGDVITYRDISQQAMKIANSLRRHGIKNGDTVAVCCENRTEFWGTAIGIILTGAVFTPISAMYSTKEINHVLDISKPKLLFCSQLLFGLHESLFRKKFDNSKIIIYGNEKISDIKLYDDLIKDEPIVDYEKFEVTEVDGSHDTLFVLYSSGTTGLPKGVMLTHLNALAGCCPYFESLSEVDDSACGLSVAPWCHTMGLMSTFVTFCVGRKTIFLTKFNLDLYLSVIEKYQVSALPLVPPILVAISKSQTKHDLSSVFIIVSGAAPLREETMKLCKDRFPNLLSVIQGYGLTETTLSVTKEKNIFEPKIGSVGQVVDGCIVKVVDVETRKALGPNQEGEICVKGPNVMKGYIGIPRSKDFDNENFFRTGDIGYYDEEGFFFIVDRLKELIKYKAFQVPPAEIEDVLLQHPDVADAAVVGLEDVSAGEVPIAFVVRQSGSHVTEKEIKDFVASKLSNPKHLRGGVRFISEIPKNVTGKILRRALRNMAKNPASKL